jgi:hypothetical protein
MRKHMSVLLVAGLCLPLAVTEAQETNEQKLEKKLKEPWLVNGGWITDYDAALAKAKESGKVIFGYFSRSYSY